MSSLVTRHSSLVTPWKVKAHLLAVLSRLPGGKYLYRTLQATLRTDRTSPDEYVRKALEILRMVREAGRDPYRGTYLEIGTGWKPYLPFILSLVGVDRILTLDVNPWLTARSAAQTYEALGPRLAWIATELGLDAGVLEERYRAAGPHRGNRAELLRALRIEYRYPGDARQTGLPDQSMEVVCSSNVLEHVPPEVIEAINRETFRVLVPGGLAVHRINPGDHFSNGDPSITVANFLRYSERQWRWYGGTGLAYHNRLRCCQYPRLFEEAGLQVLTNRVRTDPRVVAQIQQGALPIHAQFAGMTPEELAADYLWLVCTRVQSASPSAEC